MKDQGTVIIYKFAKKIMTDSEIVAKEIGLQYYSLDSVGIHSVAFDKENALKLIKYCRDEVIPIVGIDVYKLGDQVTVL